MPADNSLPWILGGGAAAIAVYYWQRGRGADPATQTSLLNVLSAVGNPAGLPLIRERLQDANPEIRRAYLGL